MSCSTNKTKNSSNIDIKEYAVFVSKELIVVIKEITN